MCIWYISRLLTQGGLLMFLELSIPDELSALSLYSSSILNHRISHMKTFKPLHNISNYTN
jgi:hypothetical protein